MTVYERYILKVLLLTFRWLVQNHSHGFGEKYLIVIDDIEIELGR